MASLAIDRPTPYRAPSKMIVGGAILVGSMLLIAVVRRLNSGVPIAGVSPWLAVHLATVIPALPLGAYVMIRRKGDRLHRMLGRTWVILMIVTALASFGVRSSGHLSWIHILSLVVLVSVPRGVVMAMRGQVSKHRRVMTNVYIGLIVAGLFVFLPGRLLGSWLFG
ncbi:putative membrane protein [Sphingomonas vulcanisoli]|uniref:Membrane protein n=1 Tax=Sphingomonas vulcanisoli TaxID=1658060 RepID=A0ABX0TVE1_9SPHN|nr:DUF2306 domain-containing protein [Sphingomonas vulcanisoli]NIJ08352.1 putative membrane protein [Sphingomonas vulcanisoli]